MLKKVRSSVAVAPPVAINARRSVVECVRRDVIGGTPIAAIPSTVALDWRQLLPQLDHRPRYSGADGERLPRVELGEVASNFRTASQI